MPPTRPSRGSAILIALLVVALIAVAVHQVASGGSAKSPAAQVPTQSGMPTPTPRRAAPSTARRTALSKLLTPAQEATFERANVKLINVTNVIAPGIAGRVALARAACARLDPGVPLLRKLRRRCEPTIKATQLLVVFPQRCRATPAPCERTLRRYAVETKLRVAADRDYAKLVQRVVPSAACIDQLVVKSSYRRAGLNAAGSAAALADAIDAQSTGGARQALSQLERALRTPQQDDHPAPVRAELLRVACGLTEH